MTTPLTLDELRTLERLFARYLDRPTRNPRGAPHLMPPAREILRGMRIRLSQTNRRGAPTN